MHPLREQARELRRQGKSYREIEAALGIGRSALSYMLHDIQLTEAQKQRLQEKRLQSCKRQCSSVTRQKIRQRLLDHWSTRTARSSEEFKAKMRVVAARRYKPHNPVDPPRSLDLETYQMCLEKAPLLGYHPNWNYTMSRGRLGYVAVKCPDHPACTPRGYVPVHRLVLECKLGRPLLYREVAHHVNKNPRDNRAVNIEGTSLAQHASAHRRALDGRP